MPPSRRDELVDAAMRIFQRHGFHGTGLEKVLSEAGISRMTLYNHFKGKDELIVAALRRSDEIFRSRMMTFVDARGPDPVARILAVFDFFEEWINDKDFCGCIFINAAAEFGDADCQVRREAAAYKREVIRYLRSLCEAAGLQDAEALAEQLVMLLDGATVKARIICNGDVPGSESVNAARRAKQAAERLIAAAR
jgi:AcrR family transcriptional regulator